MMHPMTRLEQSTMGQRYHLISMQQQSRSAPMLHSPLRCGKVVEVARKQAGD